MNAQEYVGCVGECRTEPQTTLEESVVDKVRQGDTEAFSLLYRRHYDEVFRYCIHRLYDRATAEDVTSAVFVKVVEHVGKFRGDDRSFRFWVFRLASNAVISYLRDRRRREQLLERFSQESAALNDSSADETLVNRQQYWEVQRALGILNSRDQNIIALHFTEGMKLEDVASVLGSSPGTVRSQLSRALVKLRRKLKCMTEVENYIQDRRNLHE